MTVPTTVSRAGPFLGTGAITALPFSFKVFTTADVVVTRASADGVESTLVLGDDYTVSLNADQDVSPGGTVTPIVAPAEGETTTLTSGVSEEQTLDLLSGGNFSPRAIEDALDRTVILVKQLREVLNRTLSLPISVAAGGQLPVPEAGKVIGWNDTATALRNIDPATLASIVAYASWRTNIFNGTGAQTAFTLEVDPGSVNNCDVSISGVSKTPGVDFTVSGTTLTFTVAPAAGTNNVVVRYGQALPQGTMDALAVTFLAAGVGAVSRDLRSKAREWVTPEDFGCVGNGVVDDTVNFQRFLTYLADFGGNGLMGRKTYLITAALVLTNPTYGFSLRGAGTQTVIRQRTTSAVTCLSIVTPRDIVMESFKIDCGYSVTGFASHGISMRNADRVTCRGVEVYDHRNSAILTFVDADDTYGDNHIISCISRSLGNGQNGFLHEGMLRSSIQNCTVHPLDAAGTPCVGLQIKNRSKHCWIEGGYAKGCKAGVAFGGDGATFGDGPFNSWVRGVITQDCLDGGIFGKSTDCTVEYYADQTNSPAPGSLTGYALNVAGSNVNLSASVRIKGVQSGRTCVLVRSDDVSVDIPYVNGWGSNILEMSSGVNRCRLRLHDAVPAISNIYDLVLDSSGQTDNEVVFLRDLPVQALAGNQFMYFRTIGKTNNWISFNGTSETYAYRINGTDRWAFNATSLFPSVDASAALGTTARRFTNVFSQNLALVDGVTAPSTIAGHAVLYVDAADGDLKVKFGDGVTKTIAIDT